LSVNGYVFAGQIAYFWFPH